MHSGRSGTLPRVTRSPREELADGEAVISDCLTKAIASRKARPGVRNRRTERREAPRLGIEARTRPTLRRTALRPPHVGEGKLNQASGRKRSRCASRIKISGFPWLFENRIRRCCAFSLPEASRRPKRGLRIRNPGKPGFRGEGGRSSTVRVPGRRWFIVARLRALVVPPVFTSVGAYELRNPHAARAGSAWCLCNRWPKSALGAGEKAFLR